MNLGSYSCTFCQEQQNQSKMFSYFFPWSSIWNANSPISAYVNTENRIIRFLIGFYCGESQIQYYPMTLWRKLLTLEKWLQTWREPRELQAKFMSIHNVVFGTKENEWASGRIANSWTLSDIFLVFWRGLWINQQEREASQVCPRNCFPLDEGWWTVALQVSESYSRSRSCFRQNWSALWKSIWVWKAGTWQEVGLVTVK